MSKYIYIYNFENVFLTIIYKLMLIFTAAVFARVLLMAIKLTGEIIRS